MAFSETLVEEIETIDPYADVTLVIYPEARHSFDHPASSLLEWAPISGLIPSECLVQEQPVGRFVEVITGMVSTGENLGDVLAACGRSAAEADGDAEAAQIARQLLLEFLDGTMGG